jgi:methionyl-tRNA formyltransferase
VKIIFFGTSVFAAKILSYLLDQKIDIAAVVTRPDRPRGRSLQFLPSPVKELAQNNRPSLPVFQPEKASTPEFVKTLLEYDADLFVVAAYGEIIKTNLLSLPKKGCINVHASLLPKYRGAAPIQRSLMNGEKESGITIIEMVLEMDAGPILKMVKIPISEEMTYGELENKLAEISCPALLEVIRELEEGNVVKTSQDPNLVTFAPKMKPEEEVIHWDKSASEIHNLVRALSPKPGAYCQILIGESKKRLKILKSSVVKEAHAEPGQMISFGKEGWIIGCKEGALKLLEVQLEGKKAMTVSDFIKGIQQSISFLASAK